MGDDIAAMRAQTKDFIDVNPLTVVLNRNVNASDGQGGQISTPAARPAQIMRLIVQPASSAVMRTTIEGEDLIPEFVLLGVHDSDMKHGDWFMRDGSKYELAYVRDDGRSAELRYERWAEVVYRG